METIYRAKVGKVYYAVVEYHGCPVVAGSHYGVIVDPSNGLERTGGRVFTTEAGALSFLDSLPTHFHGRDGTPGAGAEITGRQVSRVLNTGTSSFYDVVSVDPGQMRAGDTVNCGTNDAPCWQRVQSIRLHSHGARVTLYAVQWRGHEAAAAPSLFSSLQRYDVVPAGSFMPVRFRGASSELATNPAGNSCRIL